MADAPSSSSSSSRPYHHHHHHHHVHYQQRVPQGPGQHSQQPSSAQLPQNAWQAQGQPFCPPPHNVPIFQHNTMQLPPGFAQHGVLQGPQQFAPQPLPGFPFSPLQGPANGPQQLSPGQHVQTPLPPPPPSFQQVPSQVQGQYHQQSYQQQPQHNFLHQIGQNPGHLPALVRQHNFLQPPLPLGEGAWHQQSMPAPQQPLPAPQRTTNTADKKVPPAHKSPSDHKGPQQSQAGPSMPPSPRISKAANKNVSPAQKSPSSHKAPQQSQSGPSKDVTAHKKHAASTSQTPAERRIKPPLSRALASDLLHRVRQRQQQSSSRHVSHRQRSLQHSARTEAHARLPPKTPTAVQRELLAGRGLAHSSLLGEYYGYEERQVPLPQDNESREEEGEAEDNAEANAEGNAESPGAGQGQAAEPIQEQGNGEEEGQGQAEQMTPETSQQDQLFDDGYLLPEFDDQFSYYYDELVRR